MAGNPIAMYGAPTVIIDAATQVWDCPTSSWFSWTLGASRTMSTPVNPAPGQWVLIDIIQDATGDRLVTWPANFSFSGINSSAPLLTRQAGSTTRMLAIYDPTAAAWRVSLYGSRLVPASKFVTQALAGPVTMAAGDITGAANVCYQTSNAVPGTVTTRTAAQMYGDDPDASVGKTWLVTISNIGAGTLTIAAGGAGVTIVGTATLAQNVTRTYQGSFTSATTATLQLTNVGSVS